MPNTQLILGQQEAFFFLTSKHASDGSPRPASVSISVDDYSKAYVASSDGGHAVHVAPKALVTVTVTINGHSADGTAIAPASRSFDIVPVPVPQADTFVLSADSVAGAINAPLDPGTGTIVGNVD